MPPPRSPGSTYAPVTTVAARHFGVSETAVGWLANIFPLLYVVLAIPAGMLLDRWFRAALLAGAVLTAVGAAAATRRTTASAGHCWARAWSRSRSRWC